MSIGNGEKKGGEREGVGGMEGGRGREGEHVKWGSK